MCTTLSRARVNGKPERSPLHPVRPRSLSLSCCLFARPTEHPSRASLLFAPPNVGHVHAATSTTLPSSEPHLSSQLPHSPFPLPSLALCRACSPWPSLSSMAAAADAAWPGRLGQSWAKPNGLASARAGPSTPPPLLLATSEPQAGQSLPFPGAPLLSVLKMKRRTSESNSKKGKGPNVNPRLI
jgi:hypothetical protein